MLTAYDTAMLLAPIPRPPFILSVGMNYRDHLAEMNTAVPDVPSSFTKHPSTVVGPGSKIIVPAKHGDMLDYEGEITFVSGLTIANDVSARDWVAPVFQQETTMDAIYAWEDNPLGKQYPSFCPMGPVLATLDEFTDLQNLHSESCRIRYPQTPELLLSPHDMLTASARHCFT